MTNRNHGNGHLSAYVGLNQLGPVGGSRRSGGGDYFLISKSSKAAQKRKRLATRTTLSASRRRQKAPITLPSLSFLSKETEG